MLTTEQIDRLLSQGANVLSGDGEKIGSIGQVFVDNESGQPSWVTVRTGLFGMSESFVPLDGARTEGDDIVVPYSKNQVKEAPRIDADRALEPAEEDRLYEHYRLNSGRTYTEVAAANADSTTQPDAAAPNRTEDHSTPAPADYATTAQPGTTTPPDAAAAPADYATTPQPGTTTQPDAAAAPANTIPELGEDQQAAGRARLRKYVTTENVTQTVPVKNGQVRLEREPITEENRDEALSRPDSEDEVILYEERIIVTKETVPVERVRLATEQVTDEATINGEVRKEKPDTVGPEDNRA